MLNKRYYIALGVVVVVTLVLLKLPSRATSQLKMALSSLYLPIFGLSASGRQVTDKATTAILPRSELAQHLEKAERENQELKIRLSQFEETARENARFRQHFAFTKQVPWKLKLVRVVGRDPANWWRTLRIDAGTREGIVA